MTLSTLTSPAQAYEQNGYYIAQRLLPVAQVQACLNDLNTVFANQLRARALADPGSLLARAKALFDADLMQFKRVMAALWRLQSVSNLFTQPCISAFLTRELKFETIFMPGGQSVHIQSHALKIPGGYFGLEAHQDWPSVQGSMDGLVAWIPLGDVAAGSFPLEIIPGSHRHGLLAPTDGNTDDKWVVRDYADSDFVALSAQAGDVVFFSNFTVHRSGLSGPDNHIRVACSNRYDNGGEASFIARGYPTAYTRGVHRALMHHANVDAVNTALAELASARPPL